MNWRLDPAKTGLLVIDVQEKLLPIMAERDRLMRKVEQVVAVAKLLGLPIFITEQAPDKLGKTAPSILTAAGDVLPRPKTTFSAVSVLPETLPQNLLIAGIETHVCVRQTIYDLRASKTVPYLLGDAVTSRSLIDHKLATKEIRHDKVVVTSVEAACWEMVGSSNHSQFREFLSLFK